MTDQEFRDLLDWWMVSDPWPTILGPDHHKRVTDFINREAKNRLYINAVDAYHRHVGDTA